MPRRPRLLLALLLLVTCLLVAVTSAGALESGRDATVHADGDCLRLRATPSTSAAVLTCLADGSTVTVLPGSQQAEGLTWRFVSVGNQTGWVVEQYLQQAAETSPPAEEPAATGGITGLLPTSGGGGLIVWGGGRLPDLVDGAGRQGCVVASLWVTDSAGAFISHIVGAPDFANAAWNTRFPGDLPARSPYVVVCNPGVASEGPQSPSSPAVSASLAGDLPAAGGFGLVVWSGGAADGIFSTARARGCDASSVWTNNAAGAFVSYISGAPAIVNEAWAARFPDAQMPGDSAVVVVCRGKEPPPSTGTGPLGPPALPPGMPALPPGPAGNQ
jgi:uncharacterized protein YraI